MKKSLAKITKDETETFNAIRDPNYSNLMLMKVKFNGKATSCICSVCHGGITPLAILVNNKIIDNNKLLCPDGVEPTN